MIQLITGAKGSGKTKQIIDMANANVDTAKGNIVFITDTDRYMFDIRHQVRIINAGCLKKNGAICEHALIGFIKGVLAGNHDIETIYIDGAHRLLNKTVHEMQDFFDDIFEVAHKTETQMVLTVSEAEENFPEFLNKFKG